MVYTQGMSRAETPQDFVNRNLREESLKRAHRILDRLEDQVAPNVYAGALLAVSHAYDAGWYTDAQVDEGVNPFVDNTEFDVEWEAVRR